MANFKKIAKKLGLTDIGPAKIGGKNCSVCQTKLRMGEDQSGYVWGYCPKCRIKKETIFIPRIGPKIKVPLHDD